MIWRGLTDWVPQPAASRATNRPPAMAAVLRVMSVAHPTLGAVGRAWRPNAQAGRPQPLNLPDWLRAALRSGHGEAHSVRLAGAPQPSRRPGNPADRLRPARAIRRHQEAGRCHRRERRRVRPRQERRDQGDSRRRRPDGRGASRNKRQSDPRRTMRSRNNGPMEPMTREEALAIRGAHVIDELPKDVHPGGEPEDPPDT